MKHILIWCSVILAIGMGEGLLTAEAVDGWYGGLNKSSLTPPNWLFGPVWVALYIMVGVFAGKMMPRKKPERSKLFHYFITQLVLNFCWTPAFFLLKMPLLALFIILALDIVLGLVIVKGLKTNEKTTFLLIPYLAWVLFASYLNLYIVIFN